VFGRDRFVHTVIWEHRKTRENRRAFSNNHEYILVYAADPAVFALTVVMLALVASLASYIPARRAARVDPIVVLRAE